MNILFLYLQWHWKDTSKGLLKALKNILKFNLNYWSIGFLLKTLFSYWRKYHMSYGEHFNPKRYFNAFVFNLMSRTIGGIIRGSLILCGLISEILIFIGGAFVFLVWIFLPFILIFGLILGVKILF